MSLVIWMHSFLFAPVENVCFYQNIKFNFAPLVVYTCLCCPPDLRGTKYDLNIMQNHYQTRLVESTFFQLKTCRLHRMPQHQYFSGLEKTAQRSKDIVHIFIRVVEIFQSYYVVVFSFSFSKSFFSSTRLKSFDTVYTIHIKKVKLICLWIV